MPKRCFSFGLLAAGWFAAGAAGATAMAGAGGGAVPAAVDPPRYRLIDAGTVAGLPRSRGVAINVHGHLLGQAIGPTQSRGFVNRDGRPIDLGPVPDAAWIHPVAINRHGVVVATASGDAEAPRSRAVVFVPDGAGYRFAWLPLAPGSSDTVASGLSDDGKVVGYSVMRSGDPGRRAYLFAEGAHAGLADTPFGPATNASAISPDGSRIAGTAHEQPPGGGEVLFSLTGRVHVALPTAAGGSVEAINDHGAVVGCSSLFRDIRATYWVDGQPFEVPKIVAPRQQGNIGCALAVDNRGEVVGYESYRYGGPGIPDDAPRAFLFSAGRSFPLDALLDPSASGWRIVEARGIDDAGRIAATARPPGGDDRAVLLVPVAAPAR